MKEETKKNVFWVGIAFGCLLAVILFVFVFYDRNEPEWIEISSENHTAALSFIGMGNSSSGVFTSEVDLTIDLKYYREITCPCAKNTSTPCLAMCFEYIGEKIK